MTPEQAELVVKRMEKDASEKFNGLQFGRDSYILGGMLEKIKFLLVISDLKFSHFDEKGNYKLPFERKK